MTRLSSALALLLGCFMLQSAHPQDEMWIKRTIEVMGSDAAERTHMARLPLADLKLPPGVRLDTLRLIDPEAERRVLFELDLEASELRWLSATPPGEVGVLEMYVSADPDLLPVGRGQFPEPVVTEGSKSAGSLVHQLTADTPDGALRLALQDSTPYHQGLKETHDQPFTDADKQWLEQLWCRRVGVQSFTIGGQELVPRHWPGYWTALNYSSKGYGYHFSRVDTVTVRRGSLTSRLTAQGSAECFHYGWGHGLGVTLGLDVLPDGRVHVRWTLDAPDDSPTGEASISSISFFPEFVAPIFDRAIWHDAEGRRQESSVSTSADKTFFDGRPGGDEWCALYSSDTGLLLGVIPENWGDGGSLHLSVSDADGWPANVCRIGLKAAPQRPWPPGETRTYSYWLVARKVAAEADVPATMSAFRQSAKVSPRVRVLTGGHK